MKKSPKEGKRQFMASECFRANKKTAEERKSCSSTVFKIQKLVLSSDCTSWANSLASTAIDAGVSVYNILGIASGNSLNRAGRCTSTTGYALIRNKMCHDKIPPRNDNLPFVQVLEVPFMPVS